MAVFDLFGTLLTGGKKPMSYRTNKGEQFQLKNAFFKKLEGTKCPMVTGCLVVFVKHKIQQSL